MARSREPSCDNSLTERWDKRRRPWEGSAACCYLSGARLLPASIIRAAISQDRVREEPNGSMWAAHTDAGLITGWEERGPAWRGPCVNLRQPPKHANPVLCRWRPGPDPDLPRSTRAGSASKLGPLGFACEVIAPISGPFRSHRAGIGPLRMEPFTKSHDLSFAQSHAFQLSPDLMVPVTAFEVDGEYGVRPSADYDGDEDAIINEYDPFAGRSAH